MHNQLNGVTALRLLLVMAFAVAIVVTWTEGAHGAIRSPTASGTVACVSPGTANITWSILNYAEAPVPVVISSAEMSGSVSGSVNILPSSIPPGAAGAATVSVDGSAVGVVLLHASMTAPFEFDIVGQVTLDGNCAPVVPQPPLPPSTDPAPTVVADVAIVDPSRVQPTYVG